LKRDRSTAALVPSPAIHRRLFLVACPGAGATVVRDLLARQPGLHEFPRTHLFLRIFGMRGRRLPWAWLGLTLGKERRMLERLAEHYSGAGEAPALPSRSLLLRRSLDALLATLDRLALAAGCRNWIETTPRHLVHVRLIERLVPRARIVHIVRDGRDVVAAQCSGERRRSPRAVVAEWNRALAHHHRCLDRPGHVFVLYEDLLADPEGELLHVMRQCGLEHASETDFAATDSASLQLAGANPARRRDDLRRQFRERFPAERRRRIERALHLHQYGKFAECVRRRQVERAYPGGQARSRADATDGSTLQRNGGDEDWVASTTRVASDHACS